MNLVGGHINQIEVESESVIVKKTSPNEILQYAFIFDDSPEAKGLRYGPMQSDYFSKEIYGFPDHRRRVRVDFGLDQPTEETKD